MEPDWHTCTICGNGFLVNQDNPEDLARLEKGICLFCWPMTYEVSPRTIEFYETYLKTLAEDLLPERDRADFMKFLESECRKHGYDPLDDPQWGVFTTHDPFDIGVWTRLGVPYTRDEEPTNGVPFHRFFYREKKYLLYLWAAIKGVQQVRS